MTFVFSFRNMERSVALENFAKEKLEAVIETFVLGQPNVHVTFQVDNLEHIAHCHLHLGKGRDVSLNVTTETMYASIDKLVDKLQRQLSEEKKKKLNHKKENSKFERAEGFDKIMAEESSLEEASIDASEIVASR